MTLQAKPSEARSSFMATKLAGEQRVMTLCHIVWDGRPTDSEQAQCHAHEEALFVSKFPDPYCVRRPKSDREGPVTWHCRRGIEKLLVPEEVFTPH